MAEKNKGQVAPPALGGVSLLTVFAVLCLTVFALLILTTSRAGYRLSEASAQAVEGYYAADYEAQVILARLRAGEWPEGVGFVDDGEQGYVEYTCPISETQELQVRVRLGDRDTDYVVLRWAAAPVGQWSPDESLDLWDGELF